MIRSLRVQTSAGAGGEFSSSELTFCDDSCFCVCPPPPRPSHSAKSAGAGLSSPHTLGPVKPTGCGKEQTNEHFIELSRLPMSNRDVGGHFMCINDLSIKTFQQTFSPYTHTHARMHTHTHTYLHTHSRKLEHTHIPVSYTHLTLPTMAVV